MRGCVRTLCALLIAGWTSLASAQIMNVQSALSQVSEDGFAGALTGSVDWREGNQEFVFLSLSGLLSLTKGKNMWLLVTSGDRMTSQGQTLLFSTSVHFRYRRNITERFGMEGFLQHAYDKLSRLKTRGLAGIGPRAKLIESEHVGLAAGAAYMFEFEKLDDGEFFIDAGQTQKNHRLSTYMFFSFSFDPKIQFLETFYFQPRWNDPDDLRLLSDTSLAVQLTEAFSVATSFTAAWDTKPPDQIKKFSTSLIQSLSVQF